MDPAELTSSDRSRWRVRAASLQTLLDGLGGAPQRALGPGLVLALLAVALLGRPAEGEAATFYVSGSGRDDARGTSPAQAWRSIGRVNRARLRPGDVVRFEAGRVFADQSLSASGSGTARRPITFASYGSGRATLSNGRGAVFVADGASHLRFRRLRLTSGSSSPSSAFSSSATGSGARDIRIQRCLLFASGGAGILSKLPTDAGWRIVDSVIRDVGDSGIILFGSRPVVVRTLVENVGRDSSIPWAKHGIYVKAPYAVIRRSTIRGYPDSGVSLRFRGARLTENRISGGDVGVGYFLYDDGFGKSLLDGNTITGTGTAGFYYDGDGAGAGTGMTPREAFEIRRNVFVAEDGVGLSIANARNAGISIVGNRFQGGAYWPILAAKPASEGRYVETRNVFVGSPRFNWNGRVLTFSSYRASSGAGRYDRLIAADDS
ncbi:MAG: right-handed parallel beta-helix repeat-containing protein [Gaiellaceae bacterium MAG52_C11]|nr:right-handed parallel beta-helix repeat-containing protein [Candidatus Gaiellasilicea maunaloa]